MEPPKRNQCGLKSRSKRQGGLRVGQPIRDWCSTEIHSSAHPRRFQGIPVLEVEHTQADPHHRDTSIRRSWLDESCGRACTAKRLSFDYTSTNLASHRCGNGTVWMLVSSRSCGIRLSCPFLFLPLGNLLCDNRLTLTVSNLCRIAPGQSKNLHLLFGERAAIF